ncbi:hypothetical protein [Streptomyces sclerotialus]|uniref:hypothetical protein n=1 Tax=Streptomyces sclerotialus TaxID=1957 RepID=UPI0018CB7D3E
MTAFKVPGACPWRRRKITENPLVLAAAVAERVVEPVPLEAVATANHSFVRNDIGPFGEVDRPLTV